MRFSRRGFLSSLGTAVMAVALDVLPRFDQPKHTLQAATDSRWTVISINQETRTITLDRPAPGLGTAFSDDSLIGSPIKVGDRLDFFSMNGIEFWAQSDSAQLGLLDLTADRRRRSA